MALFLVMREEARFWGRSFQARPEVLRPLVAWALMDGAEEGFRMSPSKCWLGVFIVSSIFLPNPDMIIVVFCSVVLQQYNIYL